MDCVKFRASVDDGRPSWDAFSRASRAHARAHTVSSSILAPALHVCTRTETRYVISTAVWRFSDPVFDSSETSMIFAIYFSLSAVACATIKMAVCSVVGKDAPFAFSIRRGKLAFFFCFVLLFPSTAILPAHISPPLSARVTTGGWFFFRVFP